MMLDCGDFAFVLEFRWRFLSLILLLICCTFIIGKLIFIISYADSHRNRARYRRTVSSHFSIFHRR